MNEPKVFGYGEDSLTLQALQVKGKRGELSKKLNTWLGLKGSEMIALQKDLCLIFYRPSFGRGKNIGEPDFIIFAKSRNRQTGYWIIGEAKWDRSGEVRGNEVSLRAEQGIVRVNWFNELFRFWATNKSYSDSELRSLAKIQSKGDTRLLQTVKGLFSKADSFFNAKHSIFFKSVLLVFTHKERRKTGGHLRFKTAEPSEMGLIEMNYTEDAVFIPLEYTRQKSRK